MSQPALASRLIEAVRVNRTWRQLQGARAIWHKRRRFGMTPVLHGGNLFLRLSRSRLQMFVETAAWTRWEVESFRLLHGPERDAGHQDAVEICLEELPGVTYRQLMLDGPLPAGSLEAAAREFHRAHRLVIPGTARAFSHGDPHLGNILFDRDQTRAYLFDFDQIHDEDAPAVWRHADDLLVFGLELLGRTMSDEWPRAGVTFFRSYPDQVVLDEVVRRLVYPAGFAAVLWGTRTARLPRSRVVERLESLVRALAVPA
jgi:hypothetical protein